MAKRMSNAGTVSGLFVDVSVGDEGSGFGGQSSGVYESPVVARLMFALPTTRFHFGDEDGLQKGLEALLTKMGVRFEREFDLSPYGRVDFWLIDEAVALEVKVQGSLAAVTRQVHGYAQHPKVKSVLLVTSRSKLARLPAKMNGKPVAVVNLWSNGF